MTLRFPARTLLCGALSAISILAFARDVDKFDSHCANILLLQDKGIQKSLHVSKSQVDQMNLFAAHHSEEVAALQKKLKGTKTDPDPELLKYFNELKDSIVGVLTPAQLKRMREITLWHAGLVALCDPVVGKRVGLSDAQMKTLRTVYQEGLKKYSDIERAAQEKVYAPYKDRTAKTKAMAEAWNKEISIKMEAAKKQVMPQLEAIRSEYDKRMRATMTSGQLSAFDALRGSPYKP